MRKKWRTALNSTNQGWEGWKRTFLFALSPSLTLHLFLKPFVVHSSRVGDWVKFVIGFTLLSYPITANPSWDLF